LKEASKRVAKLAVASALLDAVDAGVAAVVELPGEGGRGEEAGKTSVVSAWRKETLLSLSSSHSLPLSLLSPFTPLDASSVTAALAAVGSEAEREREREGEGEGEREREGERGRVPVRADWLSRRLGRRAPARVEREREREREASVETATGDRTRILLVYGTADLPPPSPSLSSSLSSSPSPPTSFPIRRGAANIPTLSLSHSRYLSVPSILHSHSLWFTPAGLKETEERLTKAERRGPKKKV
jgi:hypothetical protein